MSLASAGWLLVLVNRVEVMGGNIDEEVSPFDLKSLSLHSQFPSMDVLRHEAYSSRSVSALQRARSDLHPDSSPVCLSHLHF